MKTAMTAAQRVAALRTRRAEIGLLRLELYVHPDDREQVQKFVDKLNKKRAKRLA